VKTSNLTSEYLLIPTRKHTAPPLQTPLVETLNAQREKRTQPINVLYEGSVNLVEVGPDGINNRSAL
jgi:hypothetical protein